MKGAGRIGAFIAVLVVAGASANRGYAQDAEHGKTIFKACAACHATDHANRAGPGLEGIIGRKAGSVPGFSYRKAQKKADIVLATKDLVAYMVSPPQRVTGKQVT